MTEIFRDATNQDSESKGVFRDAEKKETNVDGELLSNFDEAGRRLDTGSTGTIKLGVSTTTAGLNRAETGSDIVIWAGDTQENRGSAPFRVTAVGDVFASSVTIPGVAKFGGDGTDGALSITSGTTTLSASSADFLIKNYSSISITGTGKLDLSDPSTNGTITILKSQGDVTLTSSDSAMIDASAMGAAGATAATSGGGADGGNGEVGTSIIVQTNSADGGNVRSGSTVGAGGVAGAGIVYILSPAGKLIRVSCGGGGAAGGRDGTGSPNAGSGGRGGGALIIECNGAFNFTTGGISTAGANGANAGTKLSEDSTGVGGGGGGAGGVSAVLYRALTANTGTWTVSGGTGGTGSAGGNNAPVGAGCGGGAGGSNRHAGGNGGAGGGDASAGNAGSTGAGTGGGTGGAGGAAGTSKGGGGGGGGGGAGNNYVVQNTDFA